MHTVRTLTSLSLLLTASLLGACSSGGGEDSGPPPPDRSPGMPGDDTGAGPSPDPSGPSDPSAPSGPSIPSPPSGPSGPSTETPRQDDGFVGIPANTGLPGAPRGGPATTTPRPDTIDLDYLAGESGRGFRPELRESEWPLAVSGLGDIDGDGTDDFAFGTSERTRVVLGDGSRLPAALDLDTLSGVRGFVLEQGLADFGGIGDVNGDGRDDVAWLAHDTGSGNPSVRVVFGRADGALERLGALPLDGRQGFAVVDGARPGDVRSVGPAGDIDGDGLGDILVGAFARNGEDHDAPNAWVIYGRDDGFPATVDVARLDPTEAIVLSSPLDPAQRAAVYDDIGTGFDASAVGGFDLNADGFADVAIGASHFDWIEQRGMLRTYVVFGSAARPGRVDMTALDGSDGVLLAGAPDFDGSGSDLVTSLGDVSGDGVDDLALVDIMGAGDEAHVIFGRAEGFGARVERDALPAGAGIALGDSSGEGRLRGLARTGDVDGDGVSDIGIVHGDGAVLLYGGVTTASLDLADPGVALTALEGSDGADVIALGDIDSDGVDDLAIGWSSRAHDTGIVAIGDIDGDGVEDVGIGPSDTAYLPLLRVLYGFGPEGFTGALPGTGARQPLKRIEEGYHAPLLARIERAAEAPLDYLNTALASGTPLGPVATACLGGRDGVATVSVDGFACAGEPLSFTFEWGGRRFSGTAGGRYAVVDTDAEGLRAIDYESFPPSGIAPGGNPYQADFSFERGGRLVLSGSALAGPDGSVEAPACDVDATTRLTTSDAEDCATLYRRQIFVLDALFGEEREVGELRFESPSP